MRPITEIIVHCAATPPEWMEGRPTSEKVAAIKRWHVEDNGWSDIGYHRLIDRDGTRADGRPIERIGAHVKGHNTGSIGVCLIGGAWSNERDDFFQHFTAAQDAALRAEIAELRKRFPAIKKVSPHYAYAAKACPGFNLEGWLRSSDAQKHVAPSPTNAPAVGFFAALLEALARIFGKDKS